MKMNLHNVALAAIAALTFTACEDYLDADNKSMGGTTADDFFATEEGLEGFKVYAYGLVNPIFTGSYITMFDNGSDLYWEPRGQNEIYDAYDIPVDDGTCVNLYKDVYKMINAANGVIEYGDKYDSDGKFLRSLGYYVLTQQFGSVPYITWYIADATTGYARTDLKTIYDGCLKDLDEVIADENLPATSSEGLVSRKAAQALAAKIALAAGWDLGTTLTNAEQGTYTVADKSYFSRAAEYAKKAIDGVTLYSSYADKWAQTNDNNNQEAFFSLNYDRAAYTTVGNEADGGHSLAQLYGNYYGEGQDIGGQKYLGSRRVKSLKALYLWDKGDERYDATFMTTVYGYENGKWATTGYYAPYNCSEATLATMGIHFYYDVANRTTDAEFQAWVDAAIASGITAKGNNFKPAYAILMGSKSRQITFNADGSIAKDEQFNYQDLIQNTGAADCVRKWDDKDALQTATAKDSYRNIPVLHASETMLTCAEALLMAGDETGALSMVNDVRSRAKAETLSSFGAYEPGYLADYSSFNVTPLDVILDERARELFGEQGRWCDLHRTKQMVRYAKTFVQSTVNLSLANISGEYKWLRPFPAAEISANSAITEADQNPGY